MTEITIKEFIQIFFADEMDDILPEQWEFWHKLCMDDQIRKSEGTIMLTSTPMGHSKIYDMIYNSGYKLKTKPKENLHKRMFGY